jgi:DNA invertase Pin-like site-specific DNA recombinase
MHIGYARVSTDDQHTENQIEQLKKAGCERIYKENASGGRWDRPELHKALEHLRRGDVLVCWKLDRLSRSLSQVVGSFAEFERSIIKERTKLGLARARANGRIGGGRYKLSPTQQAEAIKMIRLGAKSQAEIAELFNVDPSTISRMMKEVREKELLKTVPFATLKKLNRTFFA